LEAQPAKPELWDGYSNPISIFRTTETVLDNLKNIKVVVATTKHKVQ